MSHFVRSFMRGLVLLALREKCPYPEFFWSVFSCIQSECGKILSRKTPNTDTFYAVLLTLNFYKVLYCIVLKSFCIGPPTEKENKSCLCIKFQSAHLLLRGINIFRKTEKLILYDSVIEFVKSQDFLTSEELKRKYPEFSPSKLITYYVF